MEATKSELGVYIIRHVAVSDGCHGDHCPPERVWDGLEEGVLGTGFGEVDGAREQHDTCKEEKVGFRFRDLATVPHVAVADRRHRHDGPPERVWDRLEEGLVGARLGEIDGAREQHDTCNREGGRRRWSTATTHRPPRACLPRE